MSEYKLIAKEGYDDGYYWDTRFCFELDGKRYIYVDIGSGSGYIPNSGEIMEVKNDENLDMLLKDWSTDKIDEPEDLPENAASMIRQRTGHKLDEWNAFVEILKDLPYVKDIGDLNEKTETVCD